MTTERSASHVRAWFTGRIPEGWFQAPPDVAIDREEILVTGTLSEPAGSEVTGGETGAEAEAEAEADDDGAGREIACDARVSGFREDTREYRIRVAREAERRFGRKVSWAVRCGPSETAFTTASVPVMTRLRMPERAVLDTLIEAGVARSRSEALGWCVRLVGRHQEDWIAQLRDALTAVQEARASGPDQPT